MRNFIKMLKLDKADEGGTASTSTESTTETTSSGYGTESEQQSTPTSDDKKTEETGDTSDEFGYEKTSKEQGKDDKPSGDDKKPEPKEEPKEEEKEATPSTGYDKEPKKVEEKKPDENSDTDSTDVDDITTALKGLPEDEIKTYSDFAKKHKLTPEVAKAYAELRKDQMTKIQEANDASVEEQNNNILRQRATWHKELKDDSTFGGENFAKNVKLVDKILENHMPETQKVLLERKSVLPPHVMRDFAKLAKHLYSTEHLTSGDPPKKIEQKDKDEEITNDPLEFYI